MIVSYVGNFDPPWSTENDVRKAFEYLGWQVATLQENQAKWYEIRQAALDSDLLLWTSTWDDAQPFTESIDTLRQCAMFGVPTATLHLDLFWGLSRDNRQWWMNPQLFTRYIFTADGDNEEQWKKMGIEHHWLKPAIRHDAAHFGEFREEYACDVAFLGSNGVGYHEREWPYRKELINWLTENYDNFGWYSTEAQSNGVRRGIYLNQQLANTKITVGDTLCPNFNYPYYWSDRIWETLGRGGFLIHPRIKGLENYVTDGVHLRLYDFGNFKQLKYLIDYYLNHEDEREAIRMAGHELVKSKHTYRDRWKQILKEIS